jgi:hypothetical protein
MSSQNSSIPHVPMIDGDLWYIGTYPDLGDLAYGLAYRPEHEVVDHAIFQSDDDKWHLWACIRGAKIGRLLYGWEGDSLEVGPWAPTGIVMRAEAQYGESINDYNGEEWIQAPHVIAVDGVHYMFYGGHNTELGECQICLATSSDGRDWRRFRNAGSGHWAGYSRLFVGPGEARDPMIIKIGDLYHCYYTGHDKGLRRPCVVYCRTSADLYTWSDHRKVSWGGRTSGDGPWSAECPFVVYKDGYYYLFRTSEYRAPARTHVYRSVDPLDFGLGHDGQWITTLRVAAPEIVQLGGQDYISTVEDLKGGVQLARLKWL